MTSHPHSQPGNASELLPCPFCGPGQSMVDPWFDDVSKRWAVGCGRCGASSGRSIHAEGSKEAAIKSWNTRAPHGDCGVQITDAMVIEACDVYSSVYVDDDKDMGDAMREALKAALALPSANQPCPGCDGHECDDGCQYPGALSSTERS